MKIKIKGGGDAKYNLNIWFIEPANPHNEQKKTC